ncbi:MAG TPA: hypothetical protein VGG33_21220 [Polyangia bacterium]
MAIPSLRTIGSAIINLLVSLTVFSSAAGCVNVDGGAIEASWVLRTHDGRAIEGCGCADPAIARVRFAITPSVTEGSPPGSDLCAGRADCEFACPNQRGATPFFVPAGRYAINIVVLGPDGLPVGVGGGPGAVRVPAPILRDVVYGQATQLEAIAIEAGCAATCGGDVPTRACSSD